MSVRAEVAVNSVPEWVIDQMPPGYQTRMLEIQRLSTELHAMERFGRLLWDTGEPLEQAVRDVFVGLKLDLESLPAAGSSQIIVKLNTGGRLLLHVSDAESTIQKKSAALEHIFHLVHKLAGENDRVVLIANVDRRQRPSERSDAMAPDALALLQRLGANFLPAPTLFTLWTVGVQDTARARGYLDRLHAHDGGAFPAPSI